MESNNTKDNAKRAAVDTAVMIKVGLDVHARKVAVCVQVDGQTPKPAQLVVTEQVVGWLKRLQGEHAGARVVSCYEAGPLGYHLHRALVAAGIENLVVVPQRLDVDGRAQKTDRLDARALAERLDRYQRGNQQALAVVRVPTEQQEQDRAVIRQREQLVRTRRQHEARGRSLLLTQGIQVSGPWWRPARWAELAEQLPAWLRTRVQIWQTLAVQTEALIGQLQQAIEAAAPKPLPRGVGALTWMTLSREVLDWSRFSNRRQVASYTGLCPGIRQSGARTRHGSINRHGNPAVRRALIELTWRMLLWQPQYPPLRHLRASPPGSRHRRRAVVAAARRLAIDLWRLATHQTTAAALGLSAAPAPAG